MRRGTIGRWVFSTTLAAATPCGAAGDRCDGFDAVCQRHLSHCVHKTYDTQVVLQSLAGVFGQSPTHCSTWGPKALGELAFCS